MTTSKFRFVIKRVSENVHPHRTLSKDPGTVRSYVEDTYIDSLETERTILLRLRRQYWNTVGE